MLKKPDLFQAVQCDSGHRGTVLFSCPEQLNRWSCLSLGPLPLTIRHYRVTLETFDLWDIWSEWWRDMTWLIFFLIFLFFWNFWNFWQFLTISVRSCLFITLIKCLKGHKSLGSLCNVWLLVVTDGRTDQGTRSPIELFWTAKNTSKLNFAPIIWDILLDKGSNFYQWCTQGQ